MLVRRTILRLVVHLLRIHRNGSRGRELLRKALAVHHVGHRLPVDLISHRRLLHRCLLVGDGRLVIGDRHRGPVEGDGGLREVHGGVGEGGVGLRGQGRQREDPLWAHLIPGYHTLQIATKMKCILYQNILLLHSSSEKNHIHVALSLSKELCPRVDLFWVYIPKRLPFF